MTKILKCSCAMLIPPIKQFKWIYTIIAVDGKSGLSHWCCVDCKREVSIVADTFIPIRFGC